MHEDHNRPKCSETNIRYCFFLGNKLELETLVLLGVKESILYSENREIRENREYRENE